MANIKFIRRINHIVQLLKTRKKAGASFEEIAEYIMKKEETELSKRTFQRDKKDILNAFDINIAYNHINKVYYIDDEYEDIEENIFDNLLLIEAYRMCKNREDFILFESRKPRGIYHLENLIYAINNKKIISFDYDAYWTKHQSKKTIQPYALKEFEFRWYLLGKEHKVGQESGEIKIFGLDRISNLDISHSSFKKQHFDAQECFKNSYGIVLPHEEAQEIILSFDKQQGKYIKSLPLHHSQKIVSETEDTTVISLFLVPSYDFLQKILSFGNRVKVLEPSSFAEVIKKEFQKALENYKSDNK